MKMFISLIFIYMTLFFFQNCGGSYQAWHDEESSLALETDNFFNYPYKNTPKFYIDLLLFKSKKAPVNLQSFTFVGVVSYPSTPLHPIDYVVTIETLNGTTLCPIQRGTLLPGVSFINFDCVSAVSDFHPQVTMTVTSGDGDTETLYKVF